MTLRRVKAGICVSLSGQFAIQGRQALAGLEAWAHDANRSGGISVTAGQSPLPVEIVHYDDKSSVAGVKAGALRLIKDDGVQLLFGPYSSLLTNASAEVAEEHRQLLWNQGGASETVYRKGYRWIVGVLSPARCYLAELPQLVRRVDPNASRLAILQASTGAFPRELADGLLDAAKQQGFELVLRREFAAETKDFSGYLEDVKEAKPDLSLMVGRIHNDLDFAKQLAERRGLLEGNVGAVAVVATPIQIFKDRLGTGADGFLGPSQWEPSVAAEVDFGPSRDQVVDSLRRSNMAIDYPKAQAYAAGLVAQKCVEEAGSLNPEALREVASELDFRTFYGRFRIDAETGCQIGRRPVLVQWQKGEKKVVWPCSGGTPELLYPWGAASIV